MAGTKKDAKSGSMLLGVDKPSFEVTVDGITFEIGITHDPHSPQIATEKMSPTEMRVALNTSAPGSKISGECAVGELRLSTVMQPQDGAWLVTYEFTRAP